MDRHIVSSFSWSRIPLAGTEKRKIRQITVNYVSGVGSLVRWDSSFQKKGSVKGFYPPLQSSCWVQVFVLGLQGYLPNQVDYRTDGDFEDTRVGTTLPLRRDPVVDSNPHLTSRHRSLPVTTPWHTGHVLRSGLFRGARERRTVGLRLDFGRGPFGVFKHLSPSWLLYS